MCVNRQNSYTIFPNVFDIHFLAHSSVALISFRRFSSSIRRLVESFRRFCLSFRRSGNSIRRSNFYPSL
ncbi:hypothetical protein ABH966_001770 [Lysinibacillus sp. RC46]|uniref:hypothetical protein n=1 Tax=Lysinibacillus sp. RC46 TaxID=3156295 RepID=UPI003510FAEB